VKVEDANGAPKVTKMYSIQDGYKLDEWNFSGHKLIGRNWVAEAVEWNEFGEPNGPDAAVPILTRSYKIKGISTGPIDDRTFDLKTYIKPGADVLETLPGGKMIAYKYAPDKSWDEMRKAAKQPAFLENRVSKTSASKKPTALLVPAAILFAISGVVVVVMRRRLSSP